MKFSERFSIKRDLSSEEFSRGIWNPEMNHWRDVIEDYFYISKKRLNNKLCMFKLQLNILDEIVNNFKIIVKYDERLKKKGWERGTEKISIVEYESEKRHIKSEIFNFQLINKALKEIADGIVWKYFKCNRAILYLLADKQPIDVIRPDQGTISNINEFSEVFMEPDAIAIYNDITNFLRVGDVTQIKENGDIEFIETKSGIVRGKRISRQKQKMSELVEFFNTGIGDYDGKRVKIVDLEIKQRNYLSMLDDSIKKAKRKGYDALSIGNYLLLEIVVPSIISDSKTVSDKLIKMHEPIKENWEKRKDFIQTVFFLDKLDYSKHCAPFSIYPFDLETCTDIMMGRLMIRVSLNLSEIIRIIEKSNWKIVDALFLKTKDEINSIMQGEINDVPFLRIKKEGCTIDVPTSFLTRLQFELLSPSVLLQFFEEFYNRGPKDEFDFCLINYVDEQKNWL
jgi:hypothetical protein